MLLQVATTQIPHWTKQFADIASALGIIVGGVWVWYKFGLYRERFPSMEINNDISFIGENTSEYLLELSCTVENKGKVRKWVAPFDYDLLYLEDTDSFHEEAKSDVNNEVCFKNFFKEHSGTSQLNPYGKKYWVVPDWYIPFVDGNSKKRFNYLIAIPKKIKYLSLYTRFIDFNSRKKAIEYIINLEQKKNSARNSNEKKWEDKTFVERLAENVNKKSDFYNAQITLSIDSIKEKPSANNAKDKPETP